LFHDYEKDDMQNMREIVTLWDVDGTLVKMWEVHYIAYEATFRELYGIPGVDFREKYIAGKSPADIVRDVLKNRGKDDSFIEPKIHLVEPTIQKHYLPAIEKGKVEVLPGVVAILGALVKRNVTKGILSGNYLSTNEAILQKTSLAKYFNFKITTSDSEDRKERMKKAIIFGERTVSGVLPRSDIYFFDDSLGGIQNSREFGIRHISVATGATKYDELHAAKPYHVLKDLSDTQKVLRILGLE